MSETNDSKKNVDRRHFLGMGMGLGSGLALGYVLNAGGWLYAEEFGPGPGAKSDEERDAPEVKCAVIGLGEQGRALLAALAIVPGATIHTVCDSYPGIHKRALDIAPKANAVLEYQKILDNKDIQAVWIATPSHKHKEITLAALQAGKHVYCEAPLANTIEDARVIAKAAQAADKQIFHAGLQERSNPQHHHVLQFFRTGAVGTIVQVRSQWHKRTSWRRTAPTNERQTALNWRLSQKTSGGLMAEIGIHAVDVNNWFNKTLPVAVSGFGGIMGWTDGRDVQDTVQCLFQYPDNLSMIYDATLVNSFDSAYELFQGTEAAVMLRDTRAWMFKETDATALGWEVYAYKEKLGDETGIALVADATKILSQGKQPGQNRDVDPKKDAIYCSCNAFLNSIRKGKKSGSGPLEGFQATVSALKANEAIQTGNKVVFQKEWFEI